MPSFVDASETKTIQAPWWGKKEQVVIRRFGFGERQRIMGASWRLGLTEKGETISEKDLGLMNLTVMEEGIVSWTDGKGDGLPVTLAAIKKLDDRDGDYILGEVNELNSRRVRSPEEQEKFRGGAGDSDSGGDDGAAGS